MSEDDIIIDQDLIDAYNAGYLLQKHEPELLNTLLQSSDSSTYIKFLAQGRQQYEREKIIQEQRKFRDQQEEKRPKR